MKMGYARVSTDDQNPDLQLAALKQAGCKRKRIFTDKATGAHVKRPELTKCLKALNEGDTLIVWKLDRLGRSLRDLIGLLDDLKARGVAFLSLTEAIDTTTPTGRAMCSGLQSKTVRTAISANSGPDYLQLSVPPGPHYLPLRLQSAARDCNHPVRDHIICQSP